MKKSVIAFIVAPLVCGVLLLIISIVSGASGGGWLFTFIVSAAYIVSLIIGIPAHLYLIKLHKTELKSYLIMSCIISLFPFAYFILIPLIHRSSKYEFYWEGLTAYLSQTVLILMVSLVTVTVFWLIARPDKVNKLRQRE